MPDIDVDFCMRGRDSVIRYVAEKYDGTANPTPEQMHVAQIVTFGTLQAKAALRDVGRVMGMPFGDVDRIAKLMPEALGIDARRSPRSSRPSCARASRRTGRSRGCSRPRASSRASRATPRSTRPAS